MKDEVRVPWPMSVATEVRPGLWSIMSRPTGGLVLGGGFTEDEAWADAHAKLPRKTR